MKRLDQEIVMEYLHEDIKRYRHDSFPGDLVKTLEAKLLPKDVVEYVNDKYPGDLVADLSAKLDSVWEGGAEDELKKILSKDVSRYRQSKFEGQLITDLSQKIDEEEEEKGSGNVIWLFPKFLFSKQVMAIAAAVVLALAVWIAIPREKVVSLYPEERGFAMRAGDVMQRDDFKKTNVLYSRNATYSVRG